MARYWVGNGGSWQDTAHWSTSSGGVGGASVPDSSQDVIFDANSFSSGSQIVLSNGVSGGGQMIINAKTINWTGVTNTPTWGTGDADIIQTGFGGTIATNSLVLVAGMSVTYAGQIVMRAGLITTGGISLASLSSLLFFNGASVRGGLASNLNLGTKPLLITTSGSGGVGGLIQTNNFTIACGYIWITQGGNVNLQVDFGTSAVALNQGGNNILTFQATNPSGTLLEVVGGIFTIYTTAGNPEFDGLIKVGSTVASGSNVRGGLTSMTVHASSTGVLQLAINRTSAPVAFVIETFTMNVPNMTLELQQDSFSPGDYENQLSSFNVNGTVGNPVIIKSTSDVVSAVLHIVSASVSYVAVSDVRAYTENSYSDVLPINATVGGVDNGNNVGWNFGEATTLTLLTINPSFGSVDGGNTITLTGTGFVVDQTEVDIGATNIPANEVDVTSTTRLTFTAPDQPAGSVDVTVTTL